MISTEEIKKMAGLSRIEIKDEEAEALAKEVGAILDYVTEVKEIAGGNSSGMDSVPALNYKRELGGDINVMREDDNPNEGGIYREDLMAEFPERRGDYLKVKKIL